MKYKAKRMKETSHVKNLKELKLKALKKGRIAEYEITSNELEINENIKTIKERYSR